MRTLTMRVKYSTNCQILKALSCIGHLSPYGHSLLIKLTNFANPIYLELNVLILQHSHLPPYVGNLIGPILHSLITFFPTFN